MRILLLILGLALAVPAVADSELPSSEYAYKQLPDERQEKAAKALMEELRCLVCQGQTIADSDAEMAGDMRHLVRTRIAAGESPDAVRAYLIDRYGSWVTFRPPVEEPLAWPLYLAPLALFAIGLWMLRGRFRLKRKDEGA